MSGAPRDAPRGALDLRLAVGATAGWLAVLGCLAAPTGRVVVLGAVAGVAGLVAVLATRRWRGASAVALLLFCVALELLPLAGRLAHARASPLLGLARAHRSVELRLTTTADPFVLAATGVAGAPRVLVETSADALLATGPAGRAGAAGNEVATDGTVLVLGDAAAWRGVLPGQRVEVSGALQPDLDGSAFSVTLASHQPPRLLGRPPWWQRAAGRVRGSLRTAAAVLPAQERGLLPGLVDGDTAELDPVLAEHFRLAGLTHLVAVSGTNCAIIVGAVLLTLRRARVRPWLCAVVGGAVLLMFVVVARPTPSVLRAALMAVIALVSLATGRPRAALPALAAAVLGLLLWDPTLAGSASFAMSVLATGALLVIAPGWARWLRRRRVPMLVAESVAVAAAAHLVTAPVVAAISGRISLVAVPANIAAEPVVAAVTVLGFLAALLAPLGMAAARVLAWLAGWPCRWLVWDADYFGGLHGATIGWPGGARGGLLLLAVLAVLAIAAARIGARRVLVAAALTALVVLLPVRSATSGWPPPGWLFVACDVGQGDGLVLPAGPGAAVVIDTGPDPVPMDRCLSDLGVDRIPLLVLTHYHLDHVAGLPGAVRGRPVGQLITGPLGAPDSGAQIVNETAARLGLAIQSPPVGTRLRVGDVQLEVLGPRAAFHNTRSDPNNFSLVLRATVRGVRILLPGDAEIEAQQALLASGADLRAEVLKVPHHGSAYSSPAFLAATHAALAVVSVGLHNDYGHPSPVLLGELARLGIPLLRTDRDGDVAVVGRPGHVAAVVHGVSASTVGLAAPRPPSGAGAGAAGAGSWPAGSWPAELAGPRPAARVRGRAAVLTGAASVPGARMATCRPARSASTICPSRCPRSCCSWATRICSSSGRSARSPPPLAAPTPESGRPSSPARPSRAPSCPRCWVRRCSATRDSW